MSNKEKKLTMKQERFCREYVLCMNASEAYRKAFDTTNMKMETINRKAFDLKNLDKIRARIEELKSETEELLSINKNTIIADLLNIAKNSGSKEDEQIISELEQANPVQAKRLKLRKDAKEKEVAVKALTQISKMMGYDAPTKVENQTLDENGDPVDPTKQTITIQIE